MIKIIHTPAVIVLLASSFLSTVQAGSNDTSATKDLAAAMTAQVDSFQSDKKISNKICTCQLMNVTTIKAGKYSHELIGIFAEKTLEGKRKKPSYRLLDGYIHREKLYFKIVFVKSLEAEEKIQSSTNCMKLYNKLKLEHRHLMMHSIIDVDVLASLAKK